MNPADLFLVRTILITSYPSSNPAIICSTHSGGCCKSASIHTRPSPVL